MNLQIRNYTGNDLWAVLPVLKESMTADPIGWERFTKQVLLDPNFRAAGAPVALLDGEIVGFCLAIARQTPLENAPSDVDRGYITLLGVRTAQQRRGIGTQLLSAAEEYLRSQGKIVATISPYAPGYFIPGVDVNAYANGLSFLKKNGYVEVYRPLAMQTSLWEFSTPQWVREREQALRKEQVAVGPFWSQFTLELLDFVRREFPGDWVRVVRETAAKIVNGDLANRLLVAMEPKQNIVGFSHFENERFGPIGVAQSHRGRGIGHVLMCATLRAQQAAGFRAALFLWSDDKTAQRLYNAAGFKEERRFALMKKGLD